MTDTIQERQRKQAADRIDELERKLGHCMEELENFARSEFDGVWHESDFDEMLLPYRTTLNAKSPASG